MNNTQISLEDVLLETMPFAEELLQWCKTHSNFREALKIIYSDKFLHLGAIVTSYTQQYPNDEVIGVFSYDYKIKNPLFKQDFIINKNKQYKEFILFTRNPTGSHKWVKDINEFYSTYGKDGSYANSHHLTFDELPDELKDRGRKVIKLAEKIKKAGGYRPSQEKIERIHQEVMKEKNKPLTVKKKLGNGRKN